MNDGLLPAEILDRLKARHAEPQRHYHTWAHIEALLAWLEKTAGWIHDRSAVELAILYHDAIYDPRARDNEARSAALLLSELDGLLPKAMLASAETLILATAGHSMPGTADHLLRSDSAFFLDMDLSILGTEPATFESYEAAIRREYAFVPPEDYRAGRSAILRDFLERDRLYFTDYFHNRLDRQARSNLARSIARLQQA
ncbi:hypothetical protein FKG95_20460 [Denitrobaculum tricleocarpae]|uniref:N-methyl-D-aspartate receptor NMDAR2C subunit n=2 Tax=Denitrobaculum tricleocarpae TaxID=2591009 RepID=A0A545TL94_9PROT|nr:hypothetical protein FKG95_20460 [Denitrobaculum tricleocarpae]